MLGNRLKELREKHQMSVAAVAKELSVSPSTYREWEYGRSIMGEPYVKLATLFNVSLNYLLTGEEVELAFYLGEIENNVKIIRSLS